MGVLIRRNVFAKPFAFVNRYTGSVCMGVGEQGNLKGCGGARKASTSSFIDILRQNDAFFIRN